MHTFSRRALFALPVFAALAASADEAVTNTLVMKLKEAVVARGAKDRQARIMAAKTTG